VTGANTNDPGLLYYVMPFVEGESLRQRMAREKQLSVAEAIRLAVDWDVTADGQHFVFVRNDAATPGGLIVVLNWFETVRGADDGDARRP
jgi:hypothetical protein